MIYYLYILKSKISDKYYIGISKNPEIRLSYHNTKEKGFTLRYRPWEIVFTKKYLNKALASEAERKLKNWKSKKMVEKLISGKINI